MNRKVNKRPQQPGSKLRAKTKQAAIQTASSAEVIKPESAPSVNEPTSVSEPEPDAKLVPLSVVGPLSPEQLKRKDELVKIINDGLLTSLEVCRALDEIKVTGLFYPHESFQAFCQEYWPYAKSTCHQYAQSGHALRLIESAIADCPRPQNEAQLRPVRDLNDEQVIEVWRKAVVLAGKGGLSAKMVRKARNMVVERPSSKPDPKTEKDRAERAMRTAFDNWPEEERPFLIDGWLAFVSILCEELTPNGLELPESIKALLEHKRNKPHAPPAPDGGTEGAVSEEGNQT